MKTNNIFSKIFKALALLSLSLVLVNCSKDNGSSGVVNSYVMQNGICYQNVNGQLIAQSNTSLCSSTASTYVLQNGICYQDINGQLIAQANTSLCYTYNNGYTSQVCTGYYTDGYQVVNCGTQMNCAGYTLMNTTNGQIVRCQ